MFGGEVLFYEGSRFQIIKNDSFEAMVTKAIPTLHARSHVIGEKLEVVPVLHDSPGNLLLNN